MAKPVFGWSNKRDGVVVVMDDGSTWYRYISAAGKYVWQEQTPLPNTPRHYEKSGTGSTADA